PHARLLAPPPPTPAASPLSLHDALPTSTAAPAASAARATAALRVSTETGPRPRRTSCSITGATRPISSSAGTGAEPGRVDSPPRSEEHTSELQSRVELVCRLLLAKT